MKHVEPTLFSKKVSSSPVDSAEYEVGTGGFFCLSQVVSMYASSRKMTFSRLPSSNRRVLPAVWPS